VDRQRMLDLFPFPGSKITCQILPPGFSGYRPYCPYTVSPNGLGAWTAPDLDRAKRLIRASGTAGTKVTVEEFGAFAPEGRYFASLLNELGYRARLHVFPDPDHFFPFVLDSKNNVQTAGFSYLNSFPAPDGMLVTVTCHGFVPGNPDNNQNPSEFCDPAIDQAFERAREVQISDPASAGPLWAAVDHAAVDEAPWVAAITPGYVDVVSKRLGNYEANPAWGMLLDQVWVR
jgi:peptide/nickel transport system substrate-binding protein